MYLDVLILSLTLICAYLVIYHHAVYPWLLKRLAAGRQVQPPDIPRRGYFRADYDKDLPAVTIVMPAYNEAEFIGEKLRNLAQLDYPGAKLSVHIHCDGCKDNTATVARSVLAEPECQDLNARVYEHPENRGKLAVINDAVGRVETELVVLTDVSALLPIDALLAAAAHFRNKTVGAVSGGYRLLKPGSEGEAVYWKYQMTIKNCESALGSVLGSHGAFYVFRRELFQPLDKSIINDDFVLPMTIAAAGYKVVYESRVCSLELEQAGQAQEKRRRKRIAAGNMQQLLKLLYVLNPRHGWLAFNFASGKMLRALMPFCLLVVFFGSVWLAPNSTLSLIAAAIQFAVYGGVVVMHLLNYTPTNRLVRVVDYMVCGHWAGFVGASRYLLGLETGRW